MSEGALRLVQSYERSQKMQYDYVLLARLDSAFREDVTIPLLAMNEKDPLQVLHYDEMLMGFPGCWLGTVIEVLHSGCVEKSINMNFGDVCFEDFKQIKAIREVVTDNPGFRGSNHELIFVTKNGTALSPIAPEAWDAALVDVDLLSFLAQGGARDEAQEASRFWVFTTHAMKESFAMGSAGSAQQRLKDGFYEKEYEARGPHDRFSVVTGNLFSSGVHWPRDLPSMLSLATSPSAAQGN
jgi:hypothetical protein